MTLPSRSEVEQTLASFEGCTPGRFFIDTEFNEFQGELISLALVSEDGSKEFYEVVPCENPGSWVAANVIPILNKHPVSLADLQKKLAQFLAPYSHVEIVSDWPEDIKHFCDALIVGPGMRIDVPPITFVWRQDLQGDRSLLPHNALADARGNRIEATEIGDAAPQLVEWVRELMDEVERLNNKLENQNGNKE